MTRPISAAEVRRLLPKKPGKPGKYHAKKAVVDGFTFDSQGEANRWCILKLREKAGEIEDLRRQVRFSIKVNGEWICDYIADYDYIEVATRHHITEDWKPGVRTRDYIIKSKLMSAVYGIDILETGSSPRRLRKSVSGWTQRRGLKQRSAA